MTKHRARFMPINLAEKDLTSGQGIIRDRLRQTGGASCSDIDPMSIDLNVGFDQVRLELTFQQIPILVADRRFGRTHSVSEGGGRVSHALSECLQAIRHQPAQRSHFLWTTWYVIRLKYTGVGRRAKFTL